MKKVFVLWCLLFPALLFGQSVQYDVEESVTLTEQKYKAMCRYVGKVEVYVIQVMALSGDGSGTKAQDVVKRKRTYSWAIHSQRIHSQIQ